MKQVKEEVGQILKTMEVFDLKLEIFHAHPNYPEWIEATDENAQEILKELKNKFPGKKLSIRLIKTANENETEEGIKNYVEIIKPDVLIMFSTERSFLEKIFISSNTEDIAFHASIPLLSIGIYARQLSLKILKSDECHLF